MSPIYDIDPLGNKRINSVLLARQMKNMNRRGNPRVEVRLRCQVTSPALCRRGAVVTENISRTGILLVWPTDIPGVPVPEPGQMVTIEVELPAHHGFGRKCIHCQGCVVRVTPDKSGARVALSLNYMKFRAYHDRMPALERLEPAVSTWMA